VLTIDGAYDLISQHSSVEHVKPVNDEDDLKKVSEVLFALFKEADVHGTGRLTCPYLFLLLH
jgi:hypothetical protein